jgi:RNA polymerase sigma-70 factor (ECF subfamily)
MNASLKWTSSVAPVAPRTHAAPSARQVAHRRWFSSNPTLLAQLYTAHRARVTQLLIRSGVAPYEAEDVCNDVFIVALRRLHTFEGSSSASTWLCGIARKVASDHRRCARVRREVACDELPEVPTFDGPHQHAEDAELRATVREAVATLKSGPREVVREFMLNERPMEEVAKAQRVPLQTAYARLYAGQRALSKHLAEAVN